MARCLIVDDDPISATYLGGLLSSRGHDIDYAATIAAAILMLRKHPYACLLVDRRLPDGDGVDWLAKQLAASEPVICASSCVVLSGDLLAWQDLPAGVHYLRKPVDAELLLSWLHGVAPPRANAQDRAQAIALAPVLDDTQALKRLGRMESLIALRKMLRAELVAGNAWQSALADIAAVNASMAQLHRLRAACALTGCARLAQLSSLIEDTLRTGSTLESSALDTFRECVRASIAALPE